ncbi:ABC transporter substrate-binding protein [Jiangella asiatica]|uniref:ABC transporter substrate-binding protein n=1 Tax=Jiangella asiatica TaxID=2530372 RepID=A0A4R5DIP6_9ACTN|nr:ABC transporter substrate-binding protein [Jiangella asiatica]TDE13992.1 ABC transporter substrate-binding protein [Jiangella asiatica]
MVQHTLTRRQVLAAGAAAGALALTGCGRGAESGSPRSGVPADEGPPQRGGELRIPLTQEPIAPAFDMGTQAAGSVGTAGISTLAYNGLVEVIDGEIVPQLAESWEQSGPTRYVLELRRDVEFHDGTPFDAAAVKANFDRLLAPDSTAVNLPPFLESVAVLGSHQVEFTLAQPAATFLASLRRGRVMMMSPTAVEQYAESDPFKASVGTGPYVFREYRPGDRIVLERFDGYWAETNYLDAITFTIIPTTSTQIQAFLNGEFDIIGVVPAQVNQVTRDRSVVIHEFVGNTFNYLTFNQGRAPFDNVDVRRGVSAALDREGIAQGVYNGYAEPASGPFSPAIGAAYEDLSDVVAQSYSPDEAREMLRRAGFDFGAGVRFDSFTQDPWGSEADAMTAQLKEIGLDVQLEKQDFGSWADLIYTAKDFTMFNSGQTTRTVDPDEVIYPMVHSGGDLNVFGLADPELDSLLDQARVEADPGIRAEMYHDIARNVAENAHAAFTVWPKEIIAASQNVKGLTFYAGGTHAAEGCWLSS